jgi:hypothetical protein
MNESIDVINQVSELAQSGEWIAIGAIGVGLLVRLSKSDKFAAWFPVNVSAQWRSWAAMGLGVVYGVLQAVAGGKPWKTALVGGVVSALLAVSGHELIVESIRKGRELGERKAP